MVRGIEKLREFFKGFENAYVIIGGTACEIHEDNFAQIPRATKDIDIILIVEALSAEFVSRFWDFVKTAGFEQRNKGTDNDTARRREYYRFMKPTNAEFPYQVELFSRNLGLLNFPEDAHLTPIPASDDLSSLSAILMDDDYYYFTVDHSILQEGVHIANIESLICLKCKAFLEMTARRENGGPVDGRHIVKHKKDVFRLAAMLAPADRFDLPQTLKNDVRDFCEAVKSELPNNDFFKSAGLRNITAEQLLKQLENSFL